MERMNLPAGGPLTAQEDRAVQAGLNALLARQAARFSLGDTSLPAEAARELMQGLCHLLSLWPDSPPEDFRRFLALGPEEAYAAGLRRVEGQRDTARRRWRALCLSAPDLPSLSLRDTLRGMGGYFKGYDARLLPHQAPGCIDYQLCAPAPESLLGMDYTLEYLRRLGMECALLRRFDLGRVRALLEKSSPDYRTLLLNLAAPVFENGLGLALLGRDPRLLTVPPDALRALERLLGPMDERQAAAALAGASDRLCAALGIGTEEERAYWRTLAPGLLPRVTAALPTGNLGRVFVAF